MKNKKNLAYVALAGATALTVSSCGKYEDGPNFSLLSKKSRVAGDWDVKSIDGQTLTGYGISLSFDKDGGMKTTITYGTESYSYVGSWEFSSDKENLIITDADGDSDTLEIRRLTNKEMWFDEDASSTLGDIWKLEAK